MTKNDSGKLGAICLMNPACERKTTLMIFDNLKTETRTCNFGVLQDQVVIMEYGRTRQLKQDYTQTWTKINKNN